MRILHLGATFFVAALRRLGHEVFSAALSGGDCDISHPINVMQLYAELRAQGFTPDVAIYCDNGNLPLFLEMESLPCLSFFYSVDTYCNDWHMPYMHLFDHCFVAQKEYAALAASDTGGKAEWLPLFAFASMLDGLQREAQERQEAAPKTRPQEKAANAGVQRRDAARHGERTDGMQAAAEAWLTVRDLPAVFVGTQQPRNNPQRLPFLENFQRLHPLHSLQGDFVPIFQRARIVLNQSAAEEVNFRCFEAMACGAALLTEDSPHGLKALFTAGETILPVYERGNAVQAAAIAKTALHHPQELAALALRGQQLVRERHLDTHRAAVLLAQAAALAGSGLQQERLRDKAGRQAFAHTAYGMIALDMRDPALTQHRDFFLRLAAEG